MWLHAASSYNDTHHCASMAHQGLMDFHSIVTAEILRQSLVWNSVTAVLGMGRMHSIILVVVFILSFSHFLLLWPLFWYHSLFALCKATSVCQGSKLSHNLSFLHFYSSFFLHIFSNFFLHSFLISSSLNLWALTFPLPPLFVLLKSQRVVWLLLEP